MGKSVGKNRDVNTAQRAMQAIQLRAQKLTYEEIARRCGYDSRATAYGAVQRELKRCVSAQVEELRREEGLTLDIMQAECMTLFLDENNKGRLWAADRILAIMERRARLFGLDQASSATVAAAQVIIREIPAGYLGEGQS